MDNDLSVEPSAVRWLGQRFWNLITVGIAILAMTTVAGLFGRSHWLADLMTNLRVQQVASLLVAIVAATVLRKWRWLLACFVLLAFHLPWFWGAWVGPQSANASTESLSVMVTNVLTSNQKHDAILNHIKESNSEVVAVLELSPSLALRLEEDLSESHPHQIARPQGNGNFGIGLYSKLPLVDSESFELNVEYIYSISATVTKDGELFHVIATHPLPPMGGEKFTIRNAHLDLLAARTADQIQRDPGNHVVLVGDFNLTPWSPIFSDFENNSGLVRAPCGQGIATSWFGLTDAIPMAPAGLAIDHALLSEGLGCVAHEVGGDIGSDHRSIRVEVVPG